MYKAHKGSKSSDDVSACKVLSRSILRRKRVGRFGSAYDSVMGEISVMKALDHPNIVRLYEVIDDPDEDLLFMVMELVTGGDLSAPFNEKRNVPEAELRVWLRGLTLGLEHLHLSGVCHRDIKPENLLWDPRYQQVSEAAGIIAQSDKSSYSLAHSKHACLALLVCQVKLTDFGISGFVKTDMMGGDFLTSTGGSMPFFAPEMCRALNGAGYSGRAADVWACGVSLYMWMYHTMPYEAEHLPGLLQKIADEEVVYPEDKTHSESLIKLLHSMLDRAPRQRARVRDLRRDAFINDDGKEPLNPPLVGDKGGKVTVPREELANAIERIALKTQFIGDGAPGSAPTEAPADAAEAAAAEEARAKIAAEAAAEEAEKGLM